MKQESLFEQKLQSQPTGARLHPTKHQQHREPFSYNEILQNPAEERIRMLSDSQCSTYKVCHQRMTQSKINQTRVPARYRTMQNAIKKEWNTKRNKKLQETFFDFKIIKSDAETVSQIKETIQTEGIQLMQSLGQTEVNNGSILPVSGLGDTDRTNNQNRQYLNLKTDNKPSIQNESANYDSEDDGNARMKQQDIAPATRMTSHTNAIRASDKQSFIQSTQMPNIGNSRPQSKLISDEF